MKVTEEARVGKASENSVGPESGVKIFHQPEGFLSADVASI